jgi:hypothetical protein
MRRCVVHSVDRYLRIDASVGLRTAWWQCSVYDELMGELSDSCCKSDTKATVARLLFMRV